MLKYIYFLHHFTELQDSGRICGRCAAGLDIYKCVCVCVCCVCGCVYVNISGQYLANNIWPRGTVAQLLALLTLPPHSKKVMGSIPAWGAIGSGGRFSP